MEDCDLLIERFSRELSVVKDQLAILTHGLDVRVKDLVLSDEVTNSHLATTHTSSLTSLTRSSATPPYLKKSIRKISKPPQVSNSSALAIPTCLTLKELLQKVDQREWEREDLNKKYLNLMKCHIAQQLKELKVRGAMMTKAREKRRRKERALKLKLKPPRFISTGVDNKEYMANIYQSALYKAVDLEYNLKKSGKLHTSAEIKAFWDSILEIECQPKMEQTIEAKNVKCRPLLSMEELEDGEEGYTNSWAITAQPPEGKKEKLPFKLKSLQEILGDPIQNIQQRRGSAKWEGQLRKKRKAVQRAYQQAKANEMAMRTRFYHLLQDMDDTTPVPPSPLPPEAPSSLTPTLLTLFRNDIPLYQPRTPLPTTPPFPPVTPPQPLEVSGEQTSTELDRGVGAGNDEVVDADDTSSILEGGGGGRGGTSRCGEEGGRTYHNNQQKTCPVTIIPLNMASLMKTSKVMETKKKWWNNYLLTGT